MVTFKQFLIKRSYVYALGTIRYINKLDEKRACSYILTKQLIKSATSVGANIIEAQAASSKRDFINFLNHSLKSANESKFWLMLLGDSTQTALDENKKLLTETIELAKILASSILKLKNKRNF